MVVDESEAAVLYASYGTDEAGEYIVLNFDFTATDYITTNSVSGRVANQKVYRMPATVESASFDKTYIFVGSANEFAAPELTVVMSDNSEYSGTYTYSSSDPSIATVDATTGEVTIISGTSGAATITVTLEDGATTSYTIYLTETITADDGFIGTWTATNVTANALGGILTGTTDVIIEVTAEGFTFTIANVVVGGETYIDSSGYVACEGGSWYKVGGAYYLVLGENNVVEVAYTSEEESESIAMSFSINLSGIEITISNMTLTKEASSDD